MTNYIYTTDVFKRDLYINTDSIVAFTVEELGTDNALKFNIEITLVTGKKHNLWLSTADDVTYTLNQILGEE